jgi:hypothetical protein
MKTVMAIKSNHSCEHKKLLGCFDDDWKIFVETKLGNATEVIPLPETQEECEHEYKPVMDGMLCVNCQKHVVGVSPKPIEVIDLPKVMISHCNDDEDLIRWIKEITAQTNLNTTVINSITPLKGKE